MPYQAPEILDRAALGDDKYTVTELADGRKQLTPSPDSVSEPGTEINKALLDPAFKAIERMDNTLVPYDLYWWRRRATSGSYAETQQTAFGSSLGIASYYGSIITFFEHGENEDFNSSVSFQTASKININQSNGAVSLVSPTSRTVKISDYSSIYDLRTALTDMCAGKYLKFTSNSAVLYVPSVSSVNQYNVASSVDAPIRSYIGYFSPGGDWGGWGSGTDVQLIGSVKKTATGAWEIISSPTSDTYPKSGTSEGYEYEYFGTIKDAALGAMNPPGIKIKNFTSANFSGDLYTVSIPYDRFAFCVMPSSDSSKTTYIFGIADKNTLKMFAISSAWNSGDYSYDWFSKTDIVLRQYASSVSFGSGLGTATSVKVVSTGLQISSSLYRSGTLGYMKI